MSRDLPTGRVTLMFTDIEGSTKLLEALGDRYPAVLAEHRAVVRTVVAAHDGHEVDTQGDAFFVAFPDADEALVAAVAVHRGLQAAGSPVRVRIGLHTGRPERDDDGGYVGLDLHRGARICSSGHGGQVVLSEATADALRRVPTDVTLRPLGAHVLKDLAVPTVLYDLGVDGLPGTFPPLRTLGDHPTNLPPVLGDLVGRERELRAVGDALVRHRLLTLTGPGGTGKTSLVTHAVAAARERFPDGAWAVWLAEVASPDQVVPEIARTLGLRERPGSALETVVADYVRHRRLLLLLDNFEHVLAAAPVVGRLLEAAPDLQVVVTSRAPLRVRGESELRVEPLGLTPDSPGAAAPAVELFLVRAQQAHPAFDPGADLTAVTEICRRLDGLPLAVELAAARVRLLPPPLMLARLDRPLEVAGGGARHVDARQRTLRATIAWSHDLLEERLQEAFARLGVFAAPFTLEAAEEVAEVDLDDLADLLDGNLLRAAGDDSGRLGMLETVKAFARERLDALPDADAVRDRHASWVRALASNGGPELLAGGHETFIDRYVAEQEEVRAALDWLVARADLAGALACSGDLTTFWETTGQLADGRDRLRAVLETVRGHDVDLVDLARAEFGLGRLLLIAGDVTAARGHVEAALAIFERVGSPRDIVICRSHLVMTSDAGPEETARQSEQVLDFARTTGDVWAIGVALNNLADDIKARDPLRARQLLAECVTIRRRLGEHRTLAITLGNVGDVEAALGDDVAAAAAYRGSLDAALVIGYPMMLVDARLGLARVALRAGDLEQARALAGDAARRAERQLGPDFQADAAALLAEIDAAGRPATTSSA